MLFVFHIIFFFVFKANKHIFTNAHIEIASFFWSDQWILQNYYFIIIIISYCNNKYKYLKKRKLISCWQLF
jgi:hypothetical protein